MITLNNAVELSECELIKKCLCPAKLSFILLNSIRSWTCRSPPIWRQITSTSSRPSRRSAWEWKSSLWTSTSGRSRRTTRVTMETVCLLFVTASAQVTRVDRLLFHIWSVKANGDLWPEIRVCCFAYPVSPLKFFLCARSHWQEKAGSFPP